MFSVFAQILDAVKLYNIQQVQYTEKLLLEDTVPANSQKLGSVNITTLGHFYLKYFTVRFTTLYLNGANTEDDGVCHLRGKLVDGGNQKQIFNDYIPLDLISTPGRVKSSDSVNFATDPAGNNLFYPMECEYLFSESNQIQFDVKNDSNNENNYAVCFHGIRRLSLEKIK